MSRSPKPLVRSILAALALAGVVVAVPGHDQGAGALTIPPERIAGDDPYAIAVEIARQIGGGDLAQLTDLIITTGEQATDAIVSAGLSGYLDLCPQPDTVNCRRTATLLTRPDDLPEVTEQAIAASRVPASRITVLGGVAAVSDAVRAAIAHQAGWDGQDPNPVVRVGGATRYETATALVDHLQVVSSQPGELPLPASYRTIILASGANPADALTASTLAYRGGHLLMLSPPTAPDPALETALRSLGANCAVMVGGVAALGVAVESAVADALVRSGPGACEAERVAGEDRHDTAAQVANRFASRFGSPRTVMIANSRTNSMPLTAAPLARGNMNVLFTRADALPAATRNWLGQNRTITGVTLVGSQAEVSAAVGSETVITLPLPLPVPGSGPGAPAPGVSLLYAMAAFDTAQNSELLAATVTGGTGPYRFAITAGSLPPGITFDATTGAFTGPADWSLGTVVTVSAGAAHSCAILADTTARCWGSNGNGQLGDGTTTPRVHPVTVTSGAGSPLSGVTQISAGSYHTCAVMNDATARCWGYNHKGQLGDGDATNNKSTPVPVIVGPAGPSLSGVTQISAGEAHTCAVLIDATARCWGWRGDGMTGREGRLGDGVQTGEEHYPVAVRLTGTAPSGSTLSGVAQISVGSVHTCAVLVDATARCWGGNGKGQLGDGTSTNSWNPVTVGAGTPLTGIAQISAGPAHGSVPNNNAHTCAVLIDGSARCWGTNASGQLGTGTANPVAQSTPVIVGLTDVAEITTGWDFTCAVLLDTTARCWGWRGTQGRLGDGIESGAQLTPVPVAASGSSSSLSAITGISAGFHHACATAAGGARCWGSNGLNGYGGLGDGTSAANGTSTTRSTAVRVLASGTEATSPTPLGGSLVFGPTTLTVTVTDSMSATASATVLLTSGP